MWSVSQLCRCTQPLRAAQCKLLLSGTRNGINSTNLLTTRQLYTPLRNGQSNKVGLRISELFKSNKVIVRLSSSAPKPQGTTPKAVGYWLLGCSGMVFAAVVLGGVTRLTESGLSMVTWKLLGEKLPTTQVQWQTEFEKYQQYPEFKYKNRDITLSEFKWIWWMEFAHRTWGRAIGAAVFVPAAWFWMRGKLDRAMKPRVAVYCALVAAQGLMGWYMVKSGLEDRFQGPSDVPRVSQYRLAAHLSLAFILYAGLLGGALRVLRPFPVSATYQRIKELKGFTALAHTVKAMAFFTAVSGAFVAGLDAGLVYNSFPKMGDNWVPSDMLALDPLIRNFTKNPTTVQFDHKILGTATLGAFVAGLDAGLVYNSFPKVGDNWVPSDILALDPPIRNFTKNPTTVQFDHKILGTATLGAFVAGLDAGLVYNSFPKMGDNWVPSDILALDPPIRNFTENPTTVQFDHRILGTATLTAATVLWALARRKPLSPVARRVATAVGAMAWLQVVLGISTLLMYVPTPVAASHQSGSLLLLTLAIWLTHEVKLLKYIPK